MEWTPGRLVTYWQFGNPTIMVTDLDLIKKVQVTDFDHFTDFGLFSAEYLEVMGLQMGIVDSQGEEWRTLKKLVAPAFSAPRIKKALGEMNRIGKEMVNHLKPQEKEKNFDLRENLRKFSMTCIAAVVFGIDVNCFEDPNNEFMVKGKTLVEMWRFMMMWFTPNLQRWLRIPVLNPKSERYFENMCIKIVEQRKGSKVEKNDILDTMIRAGEGCDLMTPPMMFKTMVQFFSDGFESFANICNVMAYLVTAAPEVQEQLVEEMEAVMGDRQEVTEEDVRDMVFLEQVGL